MKECLSSTPISWSPQPWFDQINCARVQNLDQALEQLHAECPKQDSGQCDQRKKQNIQCDKVQNLTTALEEVHSQYPHLAPVKKGKVYDMGTILSSIENIPKASRSENYALRDTQRHDYKQLHEGRVKKKLEKEKRK